MREALIFHFMLVNMVLFVSITDESLCDFRNKLRPEIGSNLQCVKESPFCLFFCL